MTNVTVRKSRPFAVIPDDILEDTKLSLDTRLVLGWMVSRPNGWVIKIGHMCTVLGISDYVWRRQRDEMQLRGYYRQWYSRNAQGQIDWHREVSDVAACPSLSFSRVEETKDGLPMDGVAVHGALKDIPPSVNQDHLPPPPNTTERHDGPKGSGGLGEVDRVELQAALERQARQLGKARPAGWAAKGVRRCLVEGVGPGELEALAAYRRSLARADQVQDEDKPAKQIEPGTLKQQFRDIRQSKGANQ